MEYLESCRLFREEARKQRIATEWRDSITEPSFFFDLNQGQLIAPAKAETVLKLVQMARSYADYEGYGEHVALLNLVADRAELGRASVHWHRPYHVPVSNQPERWISLQDWLRGKGCPYIPTPEK